MATTVAGRSDRRQRLGIAWNLDRAPFVPMEESCKLLVLNNLHLPPPPPPSFVSTAADSPPLLSDLGCHDVSWLRSLKSVRVLGITRAASHFIHGRGMTADRNNATKTKTLTPPPRRRHGGRALRIHQALGGAVSDADGVPDRAATGGTCAGTRAALTSSGPLPNSIGPSVPNALNPLREKQEEMTKCQT